LGQFYNICIHDKEKGEKKIETRRNKQKKKKKEENNNNVEQGEKKPL
jgi:hypothetical protein